jgi:hypothetical protein
MESVSITSAPLRMMQRLQFKSGRFHLSSHKVFYGLNYGAEIKISWVDFTNSAVRCVSCNNFNIVSKEERRGRSPFSTRSTEVGGTPLYLTFVGSKIARPASIHPRFSPKIGSVLPQNHPWICAFWHGNWAGRRILTL